MTPLSKQIFRLVVIPNGGGWKSAWIVGMVPAADPLLTFRLPRRRTVYTVPLSKCLDQAEKLAALELDKARRAARAARKAVKP